MKKNTVAILLVIAFFCTYLYGFLPSALLAFAGVSLLCISAFGVILEKK